MSTSALLSSLYLGETKETERHSQFRRKSIGPCEGVLCRTGVSSQQATLISSWAKCRSSVLETKTLPSAGRVRSLSLLFQNGLRQPRIDPAVSAGFKNVPKVNRSTSPSPSAGRIPGGKGMVGGYFGNHSRTDIRREGEKV